MNKQAFYFFLIIFSTIINACGQQNNLSQQLIGEWRNESLRIKINSFNNTDSTITSESKNVAEWEKNLHIRPIRTFYKSDGTYYSEYRTLSDSIFRRPSGTWVIKGDSITMNELQPEKAVFKLHVFIKNSIATFQGLIDFDGDGKMDDEYFGTQRKFSK